MDAESKGTYTAVARASTKRRRYDAAPTVARAALSRRITRLQKAVRIKNPLHMLSASLSAIFTTISTTGTLYDVQSSIAQGDDYNNRFSSKTQVRRINLRGLIRPGSTSASASVLRISVIRAVSGLVFANNLNGSYNPIVTGTSEQLYFDRFYTVPPSLAGDYYPVNLNFSWKIRHMQKFSGVGAGTTTGSSIYIIIQNDNAAGSAAPTISGNLEVFFDPM